MKLHAQATALVLAYAELAEPVIDGHHLPALQAGKVGVDAGFAGQLQQSPTAPQTQGAGQQQFAAGKVEVPALQRAHPVTAFGVTLRL